MRILFMFLLLSLVAACSSDKDRKLDEVNLAPVITMPSSMSAEEATSVTLSATVDDPEKDTLSYLWVLLEGQVSFSGETTNSPTVELPYLNETASTRFLFELTVTDSAGNSASQRLELLVIPNSQNLYAMDFLDANFKSCVMKNAEVNNWYYAFEITNLDCSNKRHDGEPRIKLTDELNEFTNLKALNLDENALSSINLSALSKLETLSLNENTISDITFPTESKLKRLSIGNNWYLRQLDLSGVSSLKELILENSMVTDFIFASDSALEYIEFTRNWYNENKHPEISNLPQLKTLILSATLHDLSVNLHNLDSLETLHFLGSGFDYITSLDLTGLLALKNVEISVTNIEKVTFDTNAQMNSLELVNTKNRSKDIEIYLPQIHLLKSLALSGLGIKDLDFSQLTMLNKLSINPGYYLVHGMYFETEAEFEEFDLSNLKSLTNLSLEMSKLTYIDLSELKLLTELKLFAPIQELNLVNQKHLTSLSVVSSRLASIGLTHQKNLNELTLGGSLLTDLDFSNQTNLNSLELRQGINLDANEVNQLVALNELEALSLDSVTGVSDIDFNLFEQLKELTLESNSISSLDVGGINTLNKLKIAKNSINDLVLPESSDFKLLAIRENQIELGFNVQQVIGNQQELEVLDLSSSGISELINFNLPSLSRLHLRSNEIQEINIDGLPALEYLSISANPLEEQTRAYLKAKAEEVGFSLYL